MLPKVQWSDLTGGDRGVAARERNRGVDGNISHGELDILCQLVKAADPKMLFEIGTFDGRSALNLAAHSSPDAHVYTLDLPKEELEKTRLPIDPMEAKYVAKPLSGARYQGTDVAYKITQLYGDSATFNFRPFFGKIDFVFIDGSHSYPYVMSDSWNGVRLVRPGGWIVWHDYVPMGIRCWPGVPQALEKLHVTAAPFANLQHISGTSFAVLRVTTPWYRRWLTPLAHARERWRRRGKSCWHAGVRASLNIRLRETRVRAGTPLTVQVRARNTGKTIWLPSCTGPGAVNLGCHLLDRFGWRLNHDYCHRALSPSDSVLPGQTVEMETELPAPPPGRYILDFDLVAEDICWFAQNGSRTVRACVEVV